MWLAGVGGGQDIVCSPGLDAAVGHPHHCWTIGLLSGPQGSVQGRLGWQEHNLSKLHYIQSLIAVIES